MTSPHAAADTIVSGVQGSIANTGTQNITVDNTGVLNGFTGGLSNSGAGNIGTLNNDGTIGGNQYGVLNGASNFGGGTNPGGTIGTINNNGLIGTGTFGIRNLSPGTIGTISNNTNATIHGNTAIENTGGIGSLTNSGSITGDVYAIDNASGATITAITNGGTIRGDFLAINNAGTIGTLSNNASVVGNTNGIQNSGSIGTLANTGSINASNGNALQNTAMMGTLTNTGSIISSAGHGVDNSGSITALVNGGRIAGPGTGLNNTGSIGSLTNSGTISGGIYNGGTITALTNSGLISSTGSALIYDIHSSIGSLANTGTIAGGINNATAQALTITGGSGATFGTLTGFGASIGTIHNNSSNVVFASGNQYLNDNIDVSGHTATNAGAVLQINNRVTITGDFAQSAGGTLMLGVASAPGTVNINDTGYGRLVVMGNATLASGSTVGVKPLSFNFAQGQRYVVLAASGALTASGVNYSATGFNVTGALQQDTFNNAFTDLILTLGGSVSNTPVNNATDGNASAALGGLFHYTGNDAGLLSVFNPAAALGTSDAANKVGAQLSPAATGTSLAQSVQVSTQAVIDVTTAHIDTVRVAQASGSGVATGERPNDVAVWGQAFYGQANQSDRTGAAGYKAGYNGTLIGVDTAFGDQWRAGGLFSYANTSMANTGDNAGSSGHATSYGVTGYAGYAGDTWYLDLSAGVAAQQYNTLRVVNFTGFSGSAAGSFDGMQYIASAQAGYPIKLDAATTLTPIGGLTYSRLHQDSYTETGSAAALQIGSASTTSIKSDLGAKLERVFKTSYGDVTPSAQLSWRHEYRDTGLRSVASFAADTTGSTSFVSQAVAPEKDTGVLVLGVTLARSQNLTLSGHYTLEAARGYTAQTADVRLRYAF